MLTNNRLAARFWRAIALLLIGGGLTGLMWAQTALASRPSQEGDLPTPTRTRVPAFLYPPYPGEQSVSAIFDHQYPNYDLGSYDKTLVAPNGRAAVCTPRPNLTELPYPCIYENPYTSFGYDEHDGYDFRCTYVPLFASADSRHVIAAGWNDPQNHRRDLGLYVKLGHDLNGDGVDDYYTSYGHLSAISVSICQASPPDYCLRHGDIIGLSGNTGKSSGPHLHFLTQARPRLTPRPSGTPSESDWWSVVDPYGWYPWPNAEVTVDPHQTDLPPTLGFVYQQSESLWVVEPAIKNTPFPLPYGEGNALPYPPTPAGTQGIVEDYAHLWTPYASTGTPTQTPPAAPFFEAKPGCWRKDHNPPGSINNAHL
jgi:hypothetical protein